MAEKRADKATPPTVASRRIVLGITGSVAAYKAAELARLWVKAGFAVDVVMTEAACRFIAPLTLQALTGRPVWTQMWQDDGQPVGDGMQHIALSRGAQAIVVAPATADFLARAVQGRADDVLSALCLARECPMFVAPAMNRQMWAHPATQRNVARLRADGVTVLGPDAGELACGEIGEGRMLSPGAIAAAVASESGGEKLLAGRRVLLTAGPTFEAIDPVRGLTNRSSGKMGFALAQAAAQAGAEVTLIAGPVSLPTPVDVTRIDVISAQEMADAVFAQTARADIFIGVAAVADYAPAAPVAQKLKKETNETLTLTLRPTVDILAELAQRAPRVFRVGFAAESQDIVTLGEAKRRRKQLPLLIANRAQDAINADDNEVVLLDDDGAHPLPRMEKTLLARELIKEVAKRLKRF